MSHWDSSHSEKPAAEPHAAKIGLWLFAIYTAIYAGFVFVSAFQPAWMAETIGGVNLAVLSGFGLILGAVLLAALYLWLVRSSTKPS